MKLGIILKSASVRSGAVAVAVAVGLVACGGSGDSGGAGDKRVVVTYSVLGAVVKDVLAGTEGVSVSVLIPNGADPHEWEPSAKDVSRINNATLVVRNGLDLEEGVADALGEAAKKNVAMFTASDHITVRRVGKGEGIPSGDPDQAEGAEDPHLWTDPVAMTAVVEALGRELKAVGIEASAGVARVAADLAKVDSEVKTILDAVPVANRKLVTGHESMGYFATRYGFALIGAVVPSLTSQAEVSASDLASLKQQIADAKVSVVFTETGTPSKVAEAVGKESGARLVPITTHALPADGTYATFLRNLATTIAKALAG
ncbi:MAG: metal ABC transporter substrate-binding protein [Acidimicrobiia bacterium]